MTDIPDTSDFTGGHFGFHLSTIDGVSFFLAISADDKRDSFRASLAWNTSPQYPKQPFSDLRAGVNDYLAHGSGEFQLGVLSPQVIPWQWHLDQPYGEWLQKFNARQSGHGRSDPSSQQAYLSLLEQMPKPCTMAQAKQCIEQVAVEIKQILEQYGLPFMRELVTGTKRNSER